MPRAARKTTKNVIAMPAPSVPPLIIEPSSADIARRAFELYCARGHQDGYDVQDWLQAERELLSTSQSTAA